MSPAIANLINAVVLIALGLMGYFTSESPSKTAFIPVGFGVALLACYPGVRNNSKVVAHVAVVLTLIILLALVMPLRGAIDRGDTAAIIRVCLMFAAGVLAMVAFVRSFIAARRNKSADSTGSAEPTD
jgi:CDP-diglyceride synthetase